MVYVYKIGIIIVLITFSFSLITSANNLLSISAKDAIKFHDLKTLPIPSQGIFNLTDMRRISRIQDDIPKLGHPYKMHFKAPQHYEVDKWEWFSPEPDPKRYRLKGMKLFWIQNDNSTVDITSENIFDLHVENKIEFILIINSLKASDFGKWVFKVFYKNDPEKQFLTIIKTITSDIRTETDFRLPTHIKPRHYRIWITPFVQEGNWTTKGRVEITAEHILLDQDSYNITLHAEDMTIMDVSVRVHPNNSTMKPAGYGYDPERDFFIIYLENSFRNNFTISVDFIGNLNDELVGLYRSSYPEINSDGTVRTVTLATTQFESTYARRALPCFDEPNLKATFQTNLGRTKSMTSLSNMNKINEGKAMASDDNFVWDEYNPTPIMSCYLLVFVVCEFEHLKANNSSKPFNIWARKDKIHGAKYAASISPSLLKYFEDYFNIVDPLPKQEKIAIPDFMSGAMENWGLNTYRETILLYNPNVSTISDKKYSATVIAHELSHIWYGNLVTMDWWDE